MYEWNGRMHRRGDGSSNIRALQQVLTDIGYSTGIDGDFGPKTETAIREIQQKAGLMVDGIVGPKTVTAINEIVVQRRQEAEALRARFDNIPSAAVSTPGATAAAPAAPAAAPTAQVAAKKPITKSV